MQVLEKDKIQLTYAHGDLLLHQLISGAFQFGHGEDAQIITELEQVDAFPAVVKEKVKTWLDGGGVNAAVKDKRSRLLAQKAERTQGMIDELAGLIGGEDLQGQIIELLTAALKTRGVLPNKPPVEVQHLHHGVLVQGEDGMKHFVPPDMIDQREGGFDDVLQRERDADAQMMRAAQTESPQGEADPDAGSMAEEIKKQPRPKRKAA